MVTVVVNGCVNEILDFYTQSSWRSFFFSIENKIDVNDEQCSTWQEHKEDILKKRIFIIFMTMGILWSHYISKQQTYYRFNSFTC